MRFPSTISARRCTCTLVKHDDRVRLFILSINILASRFFWIFWSNVSLRLTHVFLIANIMRLTSSRLTFDRILDESNYSKSSTIHRRGRTKIDALEVEKRKWNNAFTKINIWDTRARGPFRNKTAWMYYFSTSWKQFRVRLHCAFVPWNYSMYLKL